METHSFSTPRLMQKSSPLTWQVDVLRNGVDEPIATLEISNQNFGPRMRKKKVIWKLPDDPSQTPQFGVHEKERLWELFKEIKKKRRKQTKQESTNSSTTSHNSNTQRDYNTAPSTPVVSDEEGAKEEPKATKTAKDIPTSQPETTASSSSLPPPPPGFDLAYLSLQDKPNIPSPPPGFSQAPKLYLTVPAPVQIAGPMLARTFVQHVTQGFVQDWVSHYTDTCRSVLSIGTAQAMASNREERERQWKALVGPWECQASMVQEINETLLLVTLNGKTVPPTHQTILSFNLTWVLSQHSLNNYQITNETLSLFQIN